MPQFCIFVGQKQSQNMKRFTLLILLVINVLSVSAQHIWTVQTVPNTRLESDEIHVSDPDDYLSDSAEMNINTALCAIREQADVFVVTLGSIGDAEPKRFATQLLNNWGIGDAETNNGVLLLFVEDQHALEFETGYGAEETLTDARCERIFTTTIVPYFRVGDYEGGLCAGVGEIVSVYGGTIPLGLVTTLPSDDNDSGVELDDDFSIIFLLFAMILFTLPFAGLAYWLYKRNNRKSAVSDIYRSSEEAGATYINGFKTTWSGSPWEGKGCLGGMLIGLSAFVILFLVIAVVIVVFPDLKETSYYNWVSIVTLFLYLTWICYRQNHRALKMADQLASQSIRPKSVYEKALNNPGTKIATWTAPWLGCFYRLVFKKRLKQSHDFQCPKCHAELKKDGRFALPEIHALENQLQALKFTPYCCANGHEIVIREHGSQYEKFLTCAKCGAYTLKLTKTETIKEANYTQDGEKLKTYVCQHCGDILTKSVMIAKLVHYTSYSSGGTSSSSSGRSYSSHSSRHSSGGSFGGGRSGGGGFSGKW